MTAMAPGAPHTRFAPDAPVPAAAAHGFWRTLYWLKANPLELLTADMLHTPVTTRRMLGQRAVFLNTNATIEAAFRHNPGALAIDPIRKRLLGPLFRSGLAAIDGAPWRAERQRALRYFSTDRLDGYAGQALVTARAACHAAMGQRVTLLDFLSEATFQIVARCFFGSSAPGDAAAGARLFHQTLDRQMSLDIADAGNWGARIPRLTKGRAKVSLWRSARLLDGIIDRRAASLQRGEAFDDLLSAYMSAPPLDGRSRRLIREKIGTLLGAGFETTSLVVFWALTFLMHQPQALARARQEVADAAPDTPRDWPAHLPFLTAVLYETMRIYPTVPAVSRIATAPFEVDGTRIAAGDFVIANFWIANRAARTWADPDVFDPGRFANVGPAQFRSLGFFPFGLGPRACFGARFSTLNALILLSSMLSMLRPVPTAPGTPPPVWRGTLRPGTPTFVDLLPPP